MATKKSPTQKAARSASKTAVKRPKGSAHKSARALASQRTKSSPKKSKTIKKEARPERAAVSKTSKANPTGRNSSAQRTQSVAAGTTELEAISAPLPKPARPAEAKAPRRKSGWPARPELLSMPTEEVWKYYRRATSQKPVDAQRVEQIRNVLMEVHQPLVRHIAERLLQTLPKSIELDDLISAGLFGLMDAIRGFDHKRGIKFKTYCTTRIRGSILDQLRSQDWVPRLVRLKAGRIERALQRLQGEYGREPTHAELAAALEMNYSELASEMQHGT